MDAVTSSGYVEGWALDKDDPLRPLTVCVVAGGQEVGRGLANRYRWDLADSGCGTGWCAFRLRLSGVLSRLRRQSLSLWDANLQTEIFRAPVLEMTEDHDGGHSGLDEIVSSDPTLVYSIEQLRRCDGAFLNYIETEGVAAFVRAVYVYVLGRSADSSGLAAYSAKLQQGELAPYDLLRILYESDEFRSAPRQLIAPTESGFVFHRS